MNIITKICTIVGATYIVLAVLGSLDVIALKTCISNAGHCEVRIKDGASKGEKG